MLDVRPSGVGEPRECGRARFTGHCRDAGPFTPAPAALRRILGPLCLPPAMMLARPTNLVARAST